MVLPPKIVNEL